MIMLNIFTILNKKYIAKLHLNLLYGIFGRKQNLIETINVKNDDIIKYCSTHLIKSIININDNISTLLIDTEPNHKLINELNNTLETNISSNSFNIKSNVAIASAVTAYGRIFMLPFKLCEGCVYTDTDSIFTTIKLNAALLGLDIGLFKDELRDKKINSEIIQEAYFLGIKKYGFWVYDKNTKDRKEFSVFAGITRNSIPFSDIIKLFNGQILTKEVPIRFYRKFNDLSIKIKSIKVSLRFNPDKTLINNEYLPKNIYKFNHPLDYRPRLTKLIKKVQYLMGRWLKI